MRTSTFTLTGRVRGARVAIEWDSDGGFRDPTLATRELIAEGATVQVTPTGAFFDAADSPALVALLTALACFDDPGGVEQEMSEDVWADYESGERATDGRVY